MTLAGLAQTLRDQSGRYGGIKHYLEAAGALDRAASGFLKAQDLESLTVLNGAVARATRFRMESEVREKGPVVG